MKKSISIIAVLCLLLGAVMTVRSFGLADGLRVPAGGRTIYAECKIWEDGVPVTIEDGGSYKLDGGKTGTSIVISGLSAVGGKCSGDVYLYSPKKNEFEKKKANAEKDKDRIRLAFPDVLENTPYQFSLPRTSTKVLYPTVWVCFAPFIKGNPVNRIYMSPFPRQSRSASGPTIMKRRAEPARMSI